MMTSNWTCLSLFFVGCLWVSDVCGEGRIDSLLLAAHEDAGVQRTAVCDDATFLRRLSLDLIGRVPTTTELRSFLQSPDRAMAIDRLLASDEHSRFWSQLWTAMLVGRGQRRGIEREVLRRWVEDQLSDEVPLSQMAYALITAHGVTSLEGPVNYVAASRQDPVMSLSRTFLSVQLDCAQCHDHPFDRWTNDDYQSMKRFYRPTQYREVSGGIAVTDQGSPDDADKPVFLTGRSPHTSAWRKELGLMVVQSKPFSRAMVNRAWYWLMGRGIIDPVDGWSRENPASVPPLLEALADDLREHEFQLKPLLAEICRSDAYQREPTSADPIDSEVQHRLFAARTVRPMLPEQWIVSVAMVLDRPVPDSSELATRARQLLGISQQESPASDPFDWNTTTQTLVRQLADAIPAPLRDLDSLFLATLSRPPSIEERNRLVGRSSQDILFALVHSNEFTMND